MSAINWHDCIKQSNNKPDLAQELLDMLNLELPGFLQSLDQAMKDNDVKKLQFITHKLHGACCYCGANDLKEILIGLEGNIKNLSANEIQQAISNIQHEITRLQHSLKTKDYL
jgi:two-component system, NarL family, sensor histidine kinase BarA